MEVTPNLAGSPVGGLTVKLRGRLRRQATLSSIEAHRTLSTAAGRATRAHTVSRARGAKQEAPHGPLQRLLDVQHHIRQPTQREERSRSDERETRHRVAIAEFFKAPELPISLCNVRIGDPKKDDDPGKTAAREGADHVEKAEMAAAVNDENRQKGP